MLPFNFSISWYWNILLQNIILYIRGCLIVDFCRYGKINMENKADNWFIENPQILFFQSFKIVIVPSNKTKLKEIKNERSLLLTWPPHSLAVATDHRGSHLNLNWPFQQLCNLFTISRWASSQLDHIKTGPVFTHHTHKHKVLFSYQHHFIMMGLIIHWECKRGVVGTCKSLAMLFGCHDDCSRGEVWLQGWSQV